MNTPYKQKYKDRVIELRLKGHTHAAIAALLDIPKPTITSWLRKEQKTNTSLAKALSSVQEKFGRTPAKSKKRAA